MTLTEILYREELKKYKEKIAWLNKKIEWNKDNPLFFEPADYCDIIGIYHKQKNLSAYEWADCQIKYCERNIKITEKKLKEELDKSLNL